MIVNEAREFIEKWDYDHAEHKAAVFLPIPEGTDVDEMLHEIRRLGYVSHMETGAYGNVVVVTDKVGDGHS